MYAMMAFENTAQALAFLSAFGFAICLWRMRHADHQAHLIAFALMLFGTLLRELVALSYDPQSWTAHAMALSASARAFKIVGALLFVRAVTVARCGEWAWLAVAAGALLFAVAVPN